VKHAGGSAKHRSKISEVKEGRGENGRKWGAMNASVRRNCLLGLGKGGSATKLSVLRTGLILFILLLWMNLPVVIPPFYPPATRGCLHYYKWRYMPCLLQPGR
jgi:hypothetical protein